MTVRREVFYWLAILLTFALGTAAGDWTLEITGWTPGVAVLLPVFLIAATVVGWRLGANAVLSFWIAYVLTRPLGANLGDWIAVDKQLGGIGVGTLGTSVIFLTAILGTVIYLAVKRPDVIEDEADAHVAAERDPSRERKMLGYFGAVAALTVGVLAYANNQPHQAFSAQEEEAPPGPVEQLTPQQATANFPAADLAGFTTIAEDTLGLVERATSPERPPASPTSRPPGTTPSRPSNPSTRRPGRSSTARSTTPSARSERLPPTPRPRSKP